MFSQVFCTVFTLLMLIEADCHHFARRHRIYRRNEEASKTSSPFTNHLRTISSQITFPPATNLNPEQTGFQPDSADFLSESDSLQAGKAELSPGSAGLPSRNDAELSPESVGLLHQSDELSHGNIRPGNAELLPENVEFLSRTRNEQLLPVNERNNQPLENGGLPYENSEIFRNEGLPHGSIELPPESIEFPLESAELSPENVELPRSGENLSFRSAGFVKREEIGNTKNTRLTSQSNGIYPDATFESTFLTSSLAENLPTTSNPYLIHPNNYNLKGRRKNAPEKNDKLKEISNSEKIFEDATMSNFLNENDNLKDIIDYLEDDIVENNATVIPLPKGLQIKTLSKQNNGKTNATVNITSDAQKLLSFDNVTEIENRVEMQMEKEIKDDKGANTGSEELRIVETERVKPIVKKKWNVLNVRKRRTKSYNKRYIRHHRGKRSKMDSAEIPNSAFHKIARSFMSKIRRKERVVEHNNLMNRQTIPTFKKNGRRNIARGFKHVRDDLIYNKDEMVDFIKFFLKEMQEFREYKENNKNSTVSLNVLNTGERNKKFKFSAHKVKNLNINFQYPEYTNVLMSLNMALDNKINGYPNETRKIRENNRNIENGLETETYAKVRENNRNIANDFETATSAIPSINTSEIMQTLIYVDDRKGSAKITGIILLFTVVIFSFMLARWIFSDKLCTLTSQIRKKNNFYEKGQGDGMRGIKYAAIKDSCSEKHLSLEWQSEDGDWLSEKETSQVNF